RPLRRHGGAEVATDSPHLGGGRNAMNAPLGSGRQDTGPPTKPIQARSAGEGLLQARSAGEGSLQARSASEGTTQARSAGEGPLQALDQLPLALARQIDRVCDHFEEDWLAGRRPRVEDYLGQAPDEARPALVRELLRVELEQRRRAGERPAPDEYSSRFPEHLALIGSLLSRTLTADAVPPSPPAPAADSWAPLPGSPRGNVGAAAGPAALPSVPGYEIRSILGQGGMGVVYLARHIDLGRLVALKMILTGAYAGARERARFRTEAGAVARLHHPNIV